MNMEIPMTRLFAALAVLAAGSLAACTNDHDNADILGVPAPGANAINVRITGPEFLQESGEYRWTASVNGADEETAVYRWDVIWPGDATVRRTALGPTLDLFVNADRKVTLELYVHVASNGRHGATSSLVTICPFAPPLQVDDCGRALTLDR
jgi:hypothetical protein